MDCMAFSQAGILSSRHKVESTTKLASLQGISQNVTLSLEKHSKVKLQARRGRVVAMVASAPGSGGSELSSAASAALFAKEMERVAAKEALLLAIKDAGGVNALSSGKGNEGSRIDVSEKVLALERLNPTPRPTTSPLLEGEWDFVWAGTRSPGSTAAKLLLKRFPEQLATLSGIALKISEGGTVATATVKLLSAVEATVAVSTKIAVEGPLRLKEEYTEAVVSTPSVSEASLPSPVKGVVDQISAAAANLPANVKEAVENGLKFSLAGTFSREILVSYLDDEILIARDETGLPDILVRSSSVAQEVGVPEPLPEDPLDYNS